MNRMQMRTGKQISVTLNPIRDFWKPKRKMENLDEDNIESGWENRNGEAIWSESNFEP